MDYLNRLYPPPKQTTPAAEAAEQKAQFLRLVGKLHKYYQEQLSATLVCTSKFDKAMRYFIKALRRVRPEQVECFSSLRMLEGCISSWTFDETIDLPAIDLRSLLNTFLSNLNNFRLLRQHVKMNIYHTLRQLPEDMENPRQRRTREDLEVILATWANLTNRDTDLTKLEHPSVEALPDEYFEGPEERQFYRGLLSIVPKLTDLVNKIDFMLLKYQMGNS
ncbi:uncharacterized protein LOC110984201 isoform X2 [Acanthaster planci]|uniref:Uncharacterized protein LOC110984201 isoform X2 n=1 Tax=Acanthaster planci TaxID=133434 RepID=A0A8B7Z4W3_ACAPL|nr:uncharacterized protein LOC110984201 isoform X2 [Acanthaster planci]XP_022099831.1 uncharacterized protein LOC110984201 isoform X2 [Acanthaster planci]